MRHAIRLALACALILAPSADAGFVNPCRGIYSINRDDARGGALALDLDGQSGSACRLAASSYLYGMVVADDPALYDIPPTVTGDQVSAVVIRWMLDHPELMHMAAKSTVRAAILEVWPAEDLEVITDSGQMY